jgi:hypothetical protein
MRFALSRLPENYCRCLTPLHCNGGTSGCGTRLWNVLLLLSLSTCLAACAGCGPRGPQTVPVSGKVTFDGKPVTAGTIMFWPNSGEAVASGQLGPDGSYRLTTHPNAEGAVPGVYRVTIAVNADDPALAAKAAGKQRELGPLAGPVRPLVQVPGTVPLSYGDRQTSPLTAEVKPGPNTIDFNLPVEKQAS